MSMSCKLFHKKYYFVLLFSLIQFWEQSRPCLLYLHERTNEHQNSTITFSDKLFKKPLRWYLFCTHINNLCLWFFACNNKIIAFSHTPTNPHQQNLALVIQSYCHICLCLHDRVQPQSTCRSRVGNRGSISILSAGAYPTNLYVMVDILLRWGVVVRSSPLSPG